MTSLATVYKTITLLKEMGQVLELGFSDDSSRYDGRNPTPHPHLICVRCKKIVDWKSETLVDVCGQVAEESGYQMWDVAWNCWNLPGLSKKDTLWRH